MRENLSSGFLIRSDTNQVVQPQKMARGLKFQNTEVEGLYYLCRQLVCAFVFVYAKSRFSHDAAQLICWFLLKITSNLYSEVPNEYPQVFVTCMFHGKMTKNISQFSPNTLLHLSTADFNFVKHDFFPSLHSLLFF